MKNIRILLSENFHFLVVKFSVYLNRRVFVMWIGFVWYPRYIRCLSMLFLLHHHLFFIIGFICDLFVTYGFRWKINFRFHICSNWIIKPYVPATSITKYDVEKPWSSQSRISFTRHCTPYAPPSIKYLVSVQWQKRDIVSFEINSSILNLQKRTLI